MKNSLLITFEGLDGAGKTTQINLFQQYLQQLHLPYVYLREPGGTVLGEEIRTLLKSTRADLKINDLAELLLFSAARAEIIAEKIKPALAAGKIVIMDRFIDSTLAYQGGGRGLDADLVNSLCRNILGDLVIDRTYYLDLPRAVAVQRLQQTGKAAEDRLDLIADEEFWRRVRSVYLHLQKQETRYLLLDATAAVPTVQAQIKADFSQLLEQLQR
ncbi:dTMP kinase [Amygdalobacter indicium]|uniref:dTMP kinase n=1 Tax=Amygdalobacter indicium TaxID=3029272 RepID=UPI00279A5916|nr:dTMP kinase [Amygdalobacter indicium]WEG34037.1 dTMP kinase [Amygdalobacter indicium]